MHRPLVLTAQWVLPVSSPPIQNGYVRILHGRIEAVGAIDEADFRDSLPALTPGSVLTPGLINAHCHLEQSFEAVIPKLPEQTFVDWLLAVIEATRSQSSPAEKQQRCRLGAQELLRTGTTCVNDVASGPESLQTLDEAGLRAIVSLEVFHPATQPILIAHWVGAYRRFSEGYEDHPRLKTGLSPHSPYNVSPAAWQAMRQACNPARVHTHVAESLAEVHYLQGKPADIARLHQMVLNQTFSPQYLAESPVAYLAQSGLLDGKTLAAHAIHTTPADREALIAAGAHVAHCPRSNLALHGQTLKDSDWLAAGLSVALGTDGRLSTPDLDLRAEARFAMELHGWSAAQALERMTLAGARALGLEAQVGSLEVGKQADLVLWQLAESQLSANAFHLAPEALLMQPAAQVRQTLVDGLIRWERECLD